MAQVLYSILSLNSLFGAKLHLLSLYHDRLDVSFDTYKQHLLDTTCYITITINVKEIFSYHTNTPWNFPIDQEPCFLLTSTQILHQPISKTLSHYILVIQLTALNGLGMYLPLVFFPFYHPTSRSLLLKNYIISTVFVPSFVNVYYFVVLQRIHLHFHQFSFLQMTKTST